MCLFFFSKNLNGRLPTVLTLACCRTWFAKQILRPWSTLFGPNKHSKQEPPPLLAELSSRITPWSSNTLLGATPLKYQRPHQIRTNLSHAYSSTITSCMDYTTGQCKALELIIFNYQFPITNIGRPTYYTLTRQSICWVILDKSLRGHSVQIFGVNYSKIDNIIVIHYDMPSSDSIRRNWQWAQILQLVYLLEDYLLYFQV